MAKKIINEEIKEFEEKKIDYMIPQEGKQKFEKEKFIYKKITEEEGMKRLEQLVEVYNANIELYCAPIKLDQYRNLIDKDGYIKDPKIANKIDTLIYIDSDLFSYVIKNVDLIMDVFLNNVYIDRGTLQFCKEFENTIKMGWLSKEITNENILNDNLFDYHLSIIKILSEPLKYSQINAKNDIDKIKQSGMSSFININKELSLLSFSKIIADINFRNVYFNNLNLNNNYKNTHPEMYGMSFSNPCLNEIHKQEIIENMLNSLDIDYYKLNSFDFILVNKNEYELKMTKGILLGED